MQTFLRTFIKLLAGLLIFVGLPWLGWGPADPLGFIANPARLGYVVLVTLLQIVIVIKLPEVGSDRGAGSKTVQRQRVAVLLLQLLPLAIIISSPFSDSHDFAALGQSDPVRYTGLALFAVGFAGMNWAEIALGKQFSIQVTLQQGHQLITGGIYRYLRHPRYLGIMLFNAGIALLFRSWLGLILAAGLVAVLLWRIADEEAFMQAEFGAEWQEYCKRSWRLVPFIY
jgi:protein-S-isoprenylcysteine O-methyltransferase Ste14